MPCAARRCSSSQNSRRALGSTPAVGSSSSSSRGRCSMQHASASRCFHPPESVPVSWSARPVRPRSSSAAVDGGAPVGHRVDARGEVEVLADREVVPEREPLRHVADVALDRRGLAAQVVSQARAGARVRRQEAAHHADGRRLAAAVGPQEAEDLAARDREGQVDDHVLAAEALVEVVDVDGRLGRAARCVPQLAPSRRAPCAPRRRAAPGAPSPAGPDAAAPHAPAPGRASTMNTSLLRVSLL